MPDQAAVKALVEKISSADVAARVEGVEQAATVGPDALGALGAILGGDDPSADRAAQESMQRITFKAARSPATAKAASRQLVQLIGKDRPYKVRSESLYLLGFAADTAAIKAIAGLLTDPEVRENARMALERVPGKEAEAALMQVAKAVPADYRPAIQQSLRHRRQSPKDVGAQP